MQTRPANPQETRVFAKFREAIHKGRPVMESLVAGVHLATMYQVFRDNQIAAGAIQPGVIPDLIPPAMIATLQPMIEDWNKLEAALSGLELGEFAGMVTPDGDLTIYRPLYGNEQASERGPLIIEPSEGEEVLGHWAVVLAVTAGVVYVAHAIKESISTIADVKKAAISVKREIVQANERMSKAPESVRNAFAEMQKSANFQTAKSLFERLVGSIKEFFTSPLGIGVGAVVVGGLLLFGMRRGRG